MDTIYEQKKTVFTHELGHFISYQILYEKTLQFKPVHIKMLWNEKEQVFGGKCRHLNPKNSFSLGDSEIVETGQILNLLYGCIFQSMFRNNHRGLDECRECLDGRDDNFRVLDAISVLTIPRWKIEEVVESHFSELLSTDLSVLLNDLPFGDFLSGLSDSNPIKISAETLLANEKVVKIKEDLKSKFWEAYNELESLHSEVK